MEQLTIRHTAAVAVPVRGTGLSAVRSLLSDAGTVLGVRMDPAVGGAATQIHGASNRVGSIRGSALLIDFELSVTPHVTAFSFEATGTNVYFHAVVWTPSAMMRFRCEDLTAGGFVYSDWSSAGTMDSTMAISGQMVVGHQYQLAYQIDCIPDVVGCDPDAFREFDPQIQWTQPAREAPSVEYEYSDSE